MPARITFDAGDFWEMKLRAAEQADEELKPTMDDWNEERALEWLRTLTFGIVNGSADARATVIRAMAARQMYEALVEARDLIEGDGAEWKKACRAFLSKARAAIARASGGAA